MDPTVDEGFIRRAAELADLNALRVALFQNTHDPGLAALPAAAQLNETERNLLVSKAVSWLRENADPGLASEPPEAELRDLIAMVKGRALTDLEFDAWRAIPAFEEFPLAARWHSERPDLPDGFRVAVIGGGFGGIAMGVQLGLLGIPYVVIERQAGPGGTWAKHRYPDIRVDTASISYEFGFEKNYHWTEYFGRGPEVRRYVDHIASKYGVYENCRFECELIRAVFHESRDVWMLDLVTSRGAEILEANVIVSAAGVFANPKIPDLAGRDVYEGLIVHPSRWPADWEATGRRVAVIGNGSTGVQLLAPIAREAEQTFVFQRTPQWISPRPKYGQPVEPEIRWLLDNFPGYWNWLRFTAMAFNDLHDFLVPDEDWVKRGGTVNPANDKVRDDLIAYIKSQTGGREDLIDRLIPDYPPFARRFVVDNGWYQALTHDNVELVTDSIVRLTAKGIETIDGTMREADTIVTATGFEVAEYLRPASYIGKGGLNLHDDLWSIDGPRAYVSLMVPEFPNMFMLYGPNSQPTSGGAGLHHWWVLWSAFAGRCIMRMIAERKTRVEVKQEAYRRYNHSLDEEAAKLLFMRPEGVPEKIYYVNNQYGRLQVNSPWRGAEFHRWCAQIEWGDLELS